MKYKHNESKARITVTKVGVVIAASAASLGLMTGSAEASTTQSGCTVTPIKPIYAQRDNDSGDKIIRYQVNVACAANRTAVVDWQGVEEDGSTWYRTDRDDGIFSRTVSVRFVSAGATTLSYERTLPDTESGKEEIYQKVRFYVVSNGVASQRTAWERTPYVSFFN